MGDYFVKLIKIKWLYNVITKIIKMLSLYCILDAEFPVPPFKTPEFADKLFKHSMRRNTAANKQMVSYSQSYPCKRILKTLHTRSVKIES